MFRAQPALLVLILTTICPAIAKAQDVLSAYDPDHQIFLIVSTNSDGMIRGSVVSAEGRSLQSDIEIAPEPLTAPLAHLDVVYAPSADTSQGDSSAFVVTWAATEPDAVTQVRV